MNNSLILTMEQFLVFQVRINLLQQNLVTFDGTNDDDFKKISGDIVQLYHDISSSDKNFLVEEFLPQIENLCAILNTKRPFM